MIAFKLRWSWREDLNLRPPGPEFKVRSQTQRYQTIQSDTERQCSCGLHAGSLPFVCDRATLVETHWYWQGWQGYDTNNDTRSEPLLASPGREAEPPFAANGFSDPAAAPESGEAYSTSQFPTFGDKGGQYGRIKRYIELV